MTPHVDVIVLDENELIGELPIAHQFSDLLQNSFARLVVRMRFAGKDELHWPLGVVHHRGQVLDIGENQVCSLVSGEAAGKSDGERVWTQHLFESLQSPA